MTKAPPLEESKKPEPPVLLENTELRMEQLPPLITIPAPKTPKLEPPTRNELLSITQFVKEDEQLLLRTPAPNASSSVLVQSALLKVILQLTKFVAEKVLKIPPPWYLGSTRVPTVIFEVEGAVAYPLVIVTPSKTVALVKFTLMTT